MPALWSRPLPRNYTKSDLCIVQQAAHKVIFTAQASWQRKAVSMLQRPVCRWDPSLRLSLSAAMRYAPRLPGRLIQAPG